MSAPAPRGIARVAGGFVVQAALLLFLAGTWWWPSAWAYLVGYLAFAAAVALDLARRDPALLEREPRLRVGRRVEVPVIGTLVLLLTALFAVIALDAARFDWTSVPVAGRVVGFLLLSGAGWLVARSLQEDARASDVVAVGPDARPRIVTSGPYAVVRHPLHTAFMVWAVALPVALGSAWGLVVAAVIVGADALFVTLDDRALREDDLRWRAYAALTRWRLVPGVW